MPSADKASAVPHGTLFAPLKGAKELGMPKLTTTSAKAGPDIIDIRRAEVEINLKSEVRSMFRAKDGPRKLPTLLLYDERGLQLFEEVKLATALCHRHFLRAAR
jgi:L-histidine Nalpha-methyltransferase / hercynylcysteine S-oxide synthase